MSDRVCVRIRETARIGLSLNRLSPRDANHAPKEINMKNLRLLGLVFGVVIIFILGTQTSAYSQGKGHGKGSIAGIGNNSGKGKSSGPRKSDDALWSGTGKQKMKYKNK